MTSPAETSSARRLRRAAEAVGATPPRTGPSVAEIERNAAVWPGAAQARSLAPCVVFHDLGEVATTAGERGAVMRRLLERGAVLRPPSKRRGAREEGWPALPKHHNGIDDHDRAAGDGDLLFFTNARPRTRGLSLAFDLDTLFGQGPVGWRSRDLALLYLAAIEAGFPRRLRVFADAFTAWDGAAVRRAAALESEAMFSERSQDRSASLCKLKSLWMASVWNSERVRTLRANVPGLREAWFPEAMASLLDADEVKAGKRRENGTASEIVLRGEVPLGSALAWYDELTGTWRRIGGRAETP
jgi:hypothetical protein